MLKAKSFLITGGTGSFGKQLTATLLKRPEVERIIIYSRDELKQFEMANAEPFRSEAGRLRFFLGDVRDRERLNMAMEDVEVVVHAAALKQVPAAEYNPFEAIKTNVIGGQNVIDASRQAGVARVIALSTDKAAAPINLYGATKLCSDKLFVAANNYAGKHDIRYSVVRYGNVMGSRGSVIPFFLNQVKAGTSLSITDERMTRFNITLQQGVDFVLDCLDRMWGGELFVPKIPSYRITDVAEAIDPAGERRIVGIRPGEKLHESMITETDALNTLEFEDYFVILPSTPLWDVEKFAAESSSAPGKAVREMFQYESGSNDHFLTTQELRALVETQLGHALTNSAA